MSAKSGKIITFYSYKGGTGRTMAISNVAWILASNGYNVLLIDWDLEAPGLHRYLRPFLVDPELTHTRGLIDFVWDAARMNMTQVQGNLALKLNFPSLEDYVVGLDWTFRGNGSISFLPAGQQDENYAQRVNTFNWDNFYERLGGGKLLEAERDDLRAHYDYILIDSRTGVSDTSSICTDLLVVLFTLNRQSINGAVAVAESIQTQRGQSFPIYPVPTRIENAETDRLAAALAYARRMFAPFLVHMDPAQRASYWRDVETPYVSFYAFEEVPAAFKDEPGSRRACWRPTNALPPGYRTGSPVRCSRRVKKCARPSLMPMRLEKTRSASRYHHHPTDTVLSASCWRKYVGSSGEAHGSTPRSPSQV